MMSIKGAEKDTNNELEARQTPDVAQHNHQRKHELLETLSIPFHFALVLQNCKQTKQAVSVHLERWSNHFLG
jgi:hypothetical protein